MIRIDIDRPTKCVGEWSMYIRFDYDNRIVETIKGYPMRYYDVANKEWEVPFSKFFSFIDTLSGFDFEINSYTNEMFQEKVVKIDYNYKTSPFAHQIDGFNYGMTHNAWLLGDEQGLGKTKQVIDISCAKKELNGYKHCLIICGVNGLKWNWKNEISVHSNERGYILGERRRKNSKLFIGSTIDKLDDLINLSNIDAYFLITNVETLRDKNIVTKINELANSGEIGLIAVDEVHRCKNPASQQGKGLLNIGARDRIAMTGTPVMNNPLDLYVILKWLGYDNHSFYSFKNHYCEMGGYGGHEIVGYKHMKELREQVEEIMLRRKKEDVLDLPEKLFIDEYVEMTPKQSRIYNEVYDDVRENIDKIEIAPNPLAQLIRLRQATGYTGILSSEIAESAKLNRMGELVEDAISNGKKVVIFTNWTQMVDAVDEKLSTMLDEYGCSYASYATYITGETRDEDRQDRVNAFQNNDNIKIIIGTIGAMGTGLTLTAGTVEIFLDEPWTMAAKEQAIDRCHRIGQSNNVTIYTLLTKDTIDERIHDIVEKKGEIANSIVDGEVVGDRRDTLNFLLS